MVRPSGRVRRCAGSAIDANSRSPAVGYVSGGGAVGWRQARCASATRVLRPSALRTRCARSPAAVELGCDLVEFDVLELHDGTLVLAHSDDLLQVSHGAAAGPGPRPEPVRVARGRARAADASTRRWNSSARPERVGIQVDLKGQRLRGEVAAAIRRHGLIDRSVVSTFHVPSLLRLRPRRARARRAGSRTRSTGAGSPSAGCSLPVAAGGGWRLASSAAGAIAGLLERGARLGGDAPLLGRFAAPRSRAHTRTGRRCWRGRSTTSRSLEPRARRRGRRGDHQRPSIFRHATTLRDREASALSVAVSAVALRRRRRFSPRWFQLGSRSVAAADHDRSTTTTDRRRRRRRRPRRPRPRRRPTTTRAAEAASRSRPRVPHGVTIGGIHVGGLSPRALRTRWCARRSTRRSSSRSARTGSRCSPPGSARSPTRRARGRARAQRDAAAPRSRSA